LNYVEAVALIAAQLLEFIRDGRSVAELMDLGRHILGRHDVLDGDGEKIGQLEKVFGKSLLRSHWLVRDPAGEALFEAHESNLVIALLRRIGAIGPDWISLLEWLPFNFVLKRDGEELASYRRVLGKLRDRYVLELDAGLRDADRRLILAFAVALDALQDR